jgi:hypothetical protein
VSAIHDAESDHGRIAILWACSLLFLLRVVGQLEVLLVAPPWLPPMSDWYSGLIPYPILVPVQIAILMIMSAVVMREMQAGHRASSDARGWKRWVRGIAIAYFAVMLLRLVVQLLRGADTLIAAGGIPVAFHWVLALFLLVLGRGSSVSMGACSKGEPA